MTFAWIRGQTKWPSMLWEQAADGSGGGRVVVYRRFEQMEMLNLLQTSQSRVEQAFSPSVSTPPKLPPLMQPIILHLHHFNTLRHHPIARPKFRPMHLTQRQFQPRLSHPLQQMPMAFKRLALLRCPRPPYGSASADCQNMHPLVHPKPTHKHLQSVSVHPTHPNENTAKP